MKNTKRGNSFIRALFCAGLATTVSLVAHDYSINEFQDAFCCGSALECGSAIVQLQGGIAPTIFRDRGDFSLVACNSSGLIPAVSALIPVFQLPKFRSLYRLPFIIGGHLGYAINNNVELFAEVNYRRAKARSAYTLTGITIPNDVVNVSLSLSPFKAFDVYVGARYYWGRFWCDTTAFFLGGQFGLVHQKSITADFSISDAAVGSPSQPLTATDVTFASKSTSPAGGANFGLDWSSNCGLSLAFVVEILATCGPRTNDNLNNINGNTRAITNIANCSALPTLLPTNVIIGRIGNELYFPVTLAVKYSF